MRDGKTKWLGAVAVFMMFGVGACVADVPRDSDGLTPASSSSEALTGTGPAIASVYPDGRVRAVYRDRLARRLSDGTRIVSIDVERVGSYYVLKRVIPFEGATARMYTVLARERNELFLTANSEGSVSNHRCESCFPGCGLRLDCTLETQGPSGALFCQCPGGEGAGATAEPACDDCGQTGVDEAVDTILDRMSPYPEW